MSWWPRRRPRIRHDPETPPATPPPDPEPHETPEGQRGRHYTELAYFSDDLRRPWGSTHVRSHGTLDGEPGADSVPVTATISIYHTYWFSNEFREPPYRYLQRGEDESWAICRVVDDGTDFRPGAVERRFEPGHEDLVLHHILGLWPHQLTLEREEEHERRRRDWHDHGWD